MLKPTATIELIYADETGNTSAVVVNVPSSSSVTVMDAQATALASLIAPMTDCALVRIRYAYRVQLQANISDAGSSPVVNAGVFYFSVDPPSPDGLIVVPGIKEALVSDVEPFAGVAIDRSNSDVIAFASGVLSNGATNPFGDAFTSLVAANRLSRV